MYSVIQQGPHTHTHCACSLTNDFEIFLVEMKMMTTKKQMKHILCIERWLYGARMTKSLNCKSKEPTGRRVSRKRLITFTVWWCYNLANTNTAMQNTFSNTNTKIMRYKTSEGRMWDGKKIFALTNFEFFIQMKYLCICSHWQHVYDLRFFRGFDEVYIVLLPF